MFQFRPLARICARSRTSGLTATTFGNLAIALASSTVSVGALPQPPRMRAAGEIAGKNRDHIFAQAGDLVLDLFGGAGGQAHRADDGADADDDAEHRQQRTHLVPAQGAPGNF